MAKPTHKELLESKRNFDLNMVGIFTLIKVLGNGGLDEDAVIDIANELEDYMISVEKTYGEIWQYVDKTTPNEKGECNEDLRTK